MWPVVVGGSKYPVEIAIIVQWMFEFVILIAILYTKFIYVGIF